MGSNRSQRQKRMKVQRLKFWVLLATELGYTHGNSWSEGKFGVGLLLSSESPEDLYPRSKGQKPGISSNFLIELRGSASILVEGQKKSNLGGRHLSSGAPVNYYMYFPPFNKIFQVYQERWPKPKRKGRAIDHRLFRYWRDTTEVNMLTKINMM